MAKRSELRKLNAFILAAVLVAAAVYAANSAEIDGVNLTIYDTSDYYEIYDENITAFYANYSNKTAGLPISTGNCILNLSSDLHNMNYSLSSGLYTLALVNISAGMYNYSVSCNATDYPWLNVSDILNITNRAPIQSAEIPNISVAEDSHNASINLYNYFTDPDRASGHHTNLKWNFTAAENLTITINNMTGIINITPAANFYGERNTMLTAIDPLNGTNVSSVVFINTVNRPEISLTSPADGNPSTPYYSNSTVIFRATVSDDFPFANCSLLIDGVLNRTNSTAVAHNGTVTEMKDDDGSYETYKEIMYSGSGSNIALNITKIINVTHSPTKFRIYATNPNLGFSIPKYLVYINEVNKFNISPSDVTTSYSWVEYSVQSNYFILDVLNNITIVPYQSDDSFMMVGIDTANSYNRSLFNGTYNETGEYMIRLESVSNEITFNSSNISKGNHSWNVQCVNNRTESGDADEDYTLVISDTLPSKPTYVYCNGGACDGQTYSWEINVSCGGSVDIDNDEIEYVLEYSKDQKAYTFVTTFNGTLYEWDVSGLSSASMYLRCYPSGTNANQNNKQSGSFSISNPGAPAELTWQNITCNGGYCNNTLFTDDMINVTCNSSEDISGNVYGYRLMAEYATVNGTEWYNVTDAVGTDANRTITWNTTSIYNQTNISIKCVLTNHAVGFSTESEEVSNITLGKASAPVKPSISTVTDGLTVNITCTGSGLITYTIYANYKDARFKANTWRFLGSRSEGAKLEWNASQVYEQGINFTCQATDGTYYSQPSDYEAETLSHPPSNPVDLTPSSSQNFEYSMSYYCGGSNNSEAFNYTIEAYYNNSNSFAWRTLNDSFPGIVEINTDSTDASKIAYDDGVYSIKNDINVYVDLPEGVYGVCVDAKGDGVLRLGYNCDQDTTSCTLLSIGTLSSSDNNYCAILWLTKPGKKVFTISRLGASSSVDFIKFRAQVSSWNVSSLPPQKDVQVRCRAADAQGSSSYIYSPALTIDRVPVYVGQDTYTYSAGSGLTLDLDELFEDADTAAWGTQLTFNVSEGVNNNVTYNFSNNNNVTFSFIADGLETITLTASDGIVNVSKNISVGVQSPVVSTGGGGGKAAMPPPVVVPVVPEVPQVIVPEAPEAPVEVPAVTPPSIRPSSPSKTFAEQIVGNRLRHYRDFSVSGSRTQVTERIKNIDVFDIDNVRIEVTIPKDIARSASEIRRIDPFSVLENDPKIMFFSPKILPGKEVSVKYAFDRELTKEEVSRISVMIIPQNISEAEKARREEELQKKIDDTAKYINISRKVMVNRAEEITAYEVNIDFQGKSVLYDVTIYEEIPKCLVEIIKEEMINSDHDFEIISEDPLIAWHFDALYKEDQIRYSVRKVAEEGCANQARAMAVAQEIIVLSHKVSPLKIAIPLLVLPLIIGVLMFFSKFGYKEAVKASEAKGGLLRHLKVDIEEIILLILIIMTVMETIGMLPGDLAFVKKILSWTVLGYIFYEASITRIIFGQRKKMVDIVLILAFFMMTLKNLVAVAKVEVLEVSWAYDIYMLFLQNNQLFEVTYFIAGLAILVAVSVYASLRIAIVPPSFLTIVGEKYEGNRSAWKWLSRLFAIHMSLIFFFIVIFNIAMEWLAIAVDSPMLTMAIFFYLFVLIKHKGRHKLISFVYKVGGVGEKFYQRFIDLFHYKKFILLGISGMLVLHALAEIGISILPYVTGLSQKLYFGEGGEGHRAIFDIFGAVKGASSSIFSAEAAGMPWHYSIILFVAYFLNIAAIVFLLCLPAYLWYHMYKHRHLPVSKVPPLNLSDSVLVLFWASLPAFLLAPAFRISTSYTKELFGVDLLTSGIAANANISLILGLSAAIGMFAYSLIATSLRWLVQRLALWASMAFFLYYIFMFYKNIQFAYVYQMQVVLQASLLMFIHIFLFLMISVIFYIGGTVSLALELWIRDELGLRAIPLDRLGIFKYHDMAHIHHATVHEPHTHGDRISFLQKYITEHLDMNQEPLLIFEHLMEHHWSPEIIEEAIRAAKIDGQHAKDFAALFSSHRNRAAIGILGSYLQRQLDMGFPASKVFGAVKNQGWKDADIWEALKEGKFRHRKAFIEHKNGAASKPVF